jgi:hypothetical protein
MFKTFLSLPKQNLGCDTTSIIQMHSIAHLKFSVVMIYCLIVYEMWDRCFEENLVLCPSWWSNVSVVFATGGSRQTYMMKRAWLWHWRRIYVTVLKKPVQDATSHVQSVSPANVPMNAGRSPCWVTDLICTYEHIPVKEFVVELSLC